MTKSDPYQELFHAMAKTPAIPKGLTMIGSDVGRVVNSAPAEQPNPMSCGDVGNVMPEVETNPAVTVTFVGATGTGKTISLNALARVVEAAGGKVFAQTRVNELSFVLDNDALRNLDKMHR